MDIYVSFVVDREIFDYLYSTYWIIKVGSSKLVVHYK